MTPQPFKAGIWYNIAFKYVTRSSKCFKDIKIEVRVYKNATYNRFHKLSIYPQCFDIKIFHHTKFY